MDRYLNWQPQSLSSDISSAVIADTGDGLLTKLSMENSRLPSHSGEPGGKSQSSPAQSHRHRHPLRETTKWVNNQAAMPQARSRAMPVSFPPEAAKLPHHTSLAPGGVLQLRDNLTESPSNAKAEDKRVSALSSEDASNSKRDSQLSTASTNASGKKGTKVFIGPWRLGKTIGKGASGRVRRARHRYTGLDAAVKIVSKKSAEILRSRSLAGMDIMTHVGEQSGRKVIPFGIERECVIMKLIEHPNVIRLYDMWENRGEL